MGDVIPWTRIVEGGGEGDLANPATGAAV